MRKETEIMKKVKCEMAALQAFCCGLPHLFTVSLKDLNQLNIYVMFAV